MSTSVEQIKEGQAPNGATLERVRHHPLAGAAGRGLPRFPMVAAPFVAASATILAVRLARRQAQAAKPSVYWSFSVASGNRLTFRPTLAPRFGSLLLGMGRRRSGRRFRR